MSLNQKSQQNHKVRPDRMTSIARKLHRSLILKKTGSYLKWDIFLFFGMMAGWICSREMTELGGIDSHFRRYFNGVPPFKGIMYIVADSEGNELLKLPLYPVFCVAVTVVLILIVLQLLSLVMSYRRENNKIRRILAPLNEIALKADELSRMTFSEDKYQQIEDAISSLSPEETELLSFGDADLAGIEAAMNNLLMRMRDSYRQQSRFVNDASHELRTPIAVIQGYASMLARWGRSDEKVLDESIAAIQHESEHMKYLVEQLLFLARGDSGKTKLTMTQVTINQLVREIYEESLMIDEAHPYRFRDADEPLQVYADPGMLKQAVRILVDNAAKYTREGDGITLSVGKSGEGNPYIQVQDHGIGMAEADVAHMFERFYRADDARGYQGTGLGLSIAKWIVDKHKGYFEILSRTELGTRIRIVL